MAAMRATACYLAIFLSPCLCFPVRLSAKDCGVSAGHYQSFDGFDVVPSTPKTGEVFQVTNHFTFDANVSGGEIALKVTHTALGVFPLLLRNDGICCYSHGTGPLCGTDTFYEVLFHDVKVATVTIYGLACPLTKGSVDIKYDIKLVSILPPVLGDAVFHLTAKDQKGTDILCVQATLGIQFEDNLDAHAANSYMIKSSATASGNDNVIV